MYKDFSTIYEEKIREDFDYKKMAAFVTRALDDQGIRPQAVLDMGCGTGYAALEFVRTAGSMVLCDPSPEMLALARNKFKPPALPRLIQGSADEVSLPGQFDLVLSVLDIPNYLSESQLAAYLGLSYNNLKARGLLVFDLSSVHKLEEMARIGTFIVDEADYFHVWENHLAEGPPQRLDMELNVFLKAAPPARGLYERITEIQSMFLHPVEQVTRQAQTAGFKVAGIYDDYTLKPADDRTKRLVFVLIKENR